MRGEGDGLHAGRADLVDGRRLGAFWASGGEGDLPRGALSKAGRDDIAKVDLLDELGVELDVVQGLLGGDRAQLGTGERLERALERAYRRASCRDDDDLVGLVERLMWGSGIGQSKSPDRRRRCSP